MHKNSNASSSSRKPRILKKMRSRETVKITATERLKTSRSLPFISEAYPFP
ncbi:hypothetical protein J7L70_04535 [Candidatus Bathyarchaeota archaeon]|nr:hypothetical protein [Candidatus Bathyarchaeota archaeon]